jgi:hypothetical protein
MKHTVVTETSTARDFLTRAIKTMNDRGKRYDSPGGERSMGKAVDAFNVITGRSLTTSEGWLLLQILKDVRQYYGASYHEDSALDCVAYAALKAEALAEHRLSPQGKGVKS